MEQLSFVLRAKFLPNGDAYLFIYARDLFTPIKIYAFTFEICLFTRDSLFVYRGIFSFDQETLRNDSTRYTSRMTSNSKRSIHPFENENQKHFPVSVYADLDNGLFMFPGTI